MARGICQKVEIMTLGWDREFGLESRVWVGMGRLVWVEIVSLGWDVEFGLGL